MLINATLRAALLLVTLATLAGCKTLPQQTPKDTGDWMYDSAMFVDGLQTIAELNEWKYSAKVGVKTPTAREQANLLWHFEDQANNVRLFGPLGAGAVRIQFDDYGVVLSDNKGVKHRGDSVEALLSRIVGWPIPIDELSYWVFALPNPAEPFRYKLNESGQVTVIEQQGWSISYSNYKSYESTVLLPRKLVATKRLKQAQAVEVTLVTKDWQW